jgi:hypothetical protein
VDETTYEATPAVPLRAIPSSTLVRVNGGASRNSFSWRRPQSRAIPNRWLSVLRPVGPSSSFVGGSCRLWGLPPPRAQENVQERAQPPAPPAAAAMGRSTDADGERECARSSPPHSLHRTLDKHCFIDGGRTPRQPTPNTPHRSSFIPHPSSFLQLPRSLQPAQRAIARQVLGL